MDTVLFTGSKVSKLMMITNEIPELPDISRRNKTAGNKVVFENVGDSFSVLFVCFLAPNRFDIFRVSKNDIAGIFKDVVDRNPVLSCRLHTDILAVIICKPLGAEPKV